MQNWRKWAAIAVGVLALAAGAYLARYQGWPAIKHFKENRSLEMARKFVKSGDIRNAVLASQRVLHLNPSNTAALKLLANLAHRANSPQALEFHRRIALLEPTEQNRVALVLCALAMEKPPFPLASATLQQLQATSSNSAPVQMLAAQLAIKQIQYDSALAHLERALEIDPSNEVYRLNLASLQIQSVHESTVAQGHATLEKLAASTNVGLPALRFLIVAEMKKKRLPEALSYSSRLLENFDSLAQVSDRLQHVGLMETTSSGNAEALLQGLWRRAGTNAPDLHMIAVWMAHNQHARDALQWISDLPDQPWRQQLSHAKVECFIALREWSALQGFLLTEKWGDEEFMRLALLGQAAWELKDDLTGSKMWRSAIREAGDRLPALAALLNNANAFARKVPKEEVLWRIAERLPQEKWAYDELDRLYTLGGDTRGLNKLYKSMVDIGSTNVMVRNNFAATSLLLGVESERSHKLATQLYVESPGDPTVASTYAFSLHQQGRTREALEILNKFGPEVLIKPPVALYYGVVLSALGEQEKAARFFEAARRSQLLPEEKVLLERMAGRQSKS